jgi:hypothetical protein
MARFEHYNAAQFTPLSMQEILQPTMIMRERHDRMDEQYGKIAEESAKMGFLAEHAPQDSQMKQD